MGGAESLSIGYNYRAPWNTSSIRFRNAPWRKVIDIRYYTNKYCRPGEGSMASILECGHERYEKQSYGVHKRMRCSECGTAPQNTIEGVALQPTTAPCCEGEAPHAGNTGTSA